MENSQAEWQRRSDSLRRRCQAVKEIAERQNEELIVNRLRLENLSRESMVLVSGITNKVSLYCVFGKLRSVAITAYFLYFRKQCLRCLRDLSGLRDVCVLFCACS